MNKVIYILFFILINEIGYGQNKIPIEWIGLNKIYKDSIHDIQNSDYIKDTCYLRVEWNSSFVSLSEGNKAELIYYNVDTIEKLNFDYTIENGRIKFYDSKDVYLEGLIFQDSLMELKVADGNNLSEINYVPFKLNQERTSINCNNIKQSLIGTKWVTILEQDTVYHEFKSENKLILSTWDKALSWDIIEYKKQPILKIEYGVLFNPYFIILREIREDQLIVERARQNEYKLATMIKIK